MEEGALTGIRCQEELVPKSLVKDLEQRIRELERTLGKKTLEVEILKEGLKIAQEKKLLSRQPLPLQENLALEQ
jgi:transposase